MFKNSNRLKYAAIRNIDRLDWWIEICTANPPCIYYFGAFDSFTAAASTQHGYILDLLQEEAKIRSLSIRQCQPQQLTREI